MTRVTWSIVELKQSQLSETSRHVELKDGLKEAMSHNSHTNVGRQLLESAEQLIYNFFFICLLKANVFTFFFYLEKTIVSAYVLKAKAFTHLLYEKNGSK